MLVVCRGRKMYHFFVEEEQMQDDCKSLIITGDDYNHIANVIRLKIGDEISVSIGILATYFRVLKRLVAWGMEENGFEHLYPTPEYDFDLNIGTECKKGLETCLNVMLNNISEIQPWIMQDNIEIE